ncbi:hypothetical protein VIGAN_11225300, partial [Vigna angularis var. angularis]
QLCSFFPNYLFTITHLLTFFTFFWNEIYCCKMKHCTKKKCVSKNQNFTPNNNPKIHIHQRITNKNTNKKDPNT